MRIFSQINEIISANINGLIDSSKNPVDMARGVIRELDSEILAMRSRIRANRENEARLKRLIENFQRELHDWQSRAERAVDEDNDLLARQALERKHAYAAQIQATEASWWELNQEREQMERQLSAVEDQAQIARRRKESLQARARNSSGSSEFIAVPSSVEIKRPDRSAAEIEEELQALKDKREK